MEAVRDNNHVTVVQGVADSDGVTPTSVQMDSATGRALAGITYTASNVGTLPSQPGVRDGNHVVVGMGVLDSDGVTPAPILMDSRNNFLYVDMLIP